MPTMYANNGTNHQIKKRYAYTSTTNKQIKKRYADDGNTKHLVYSAEETVTKNFSDLVNYYATLDAANAKVSINDWGSDTYGGIRMSFSTGSHTLLKITSNLSGSGNSSAGWSVTTNKWTFNGSVSYDQYVKIGTSGLEHSCNSGSDVTTSVTVPANTTLYLTLACYHATSGSANGQITNIVLA